MMPKSPLQMLLSSPLNPPSSNEAPTLFLPTATTVLITEEDSSRWTTVYRGLVSSTHLDVSALEEVMPMWLLEYLLMNKAPVIPPTKISFVMLPWPTKNPEQQLPELLNT